LRKDKKEAYSLMSLAFVLFEGLLLILCALTMIFAARVVKFSVPGFSPEQTAATVPLLRILMPFIFFISSSALLAGGLQAIGHFFVPAFGPILLNIVFIAGIIICWFFGFPVDYLCFFILFGGLLQLLQHLFAYFKWHLSFGRIDKQTWNSFYSILGKFLLCAISMSVMEISLFVDMRFASFLATGSVTLMNYAYKFLGIPLGVFAVAFSTILLPHFSRISIYAPKRLNFYIFESAKLVFWVTIPCMLFAIFFSEKIFSTLFLSTFTPAQAYEAGNILTAFMIGLFFFSFNKILLNVFYAKHETLAPSLMCIIATTVNIGLNFLLINYLQSVGLALSTTICGILQTFLMLGFLKWRYNYHGYIARFGKFVIGYLMQLTLVIAGFLLAYYLIVFLINHFLPPCLAFFFLETVGLWMWVGPLYLLGALLLYIYRNTLHVRLYFLD